MATPRYSKIDLSVTPYYHCISRCVRKAYLCGEDPETGRNYEHRKQWLIEQIKFQTSIFAIQVLAYAIMDNHYHIDIFINVEQANHWSDEEIHGRWKQLFPKSTLEAEKKWLNSEDKQQSIAIWRERLMNVSWFMRCLNQDIAELANAEDECTGRFWEERFKSLALLDMGAVIASMIYIDLNPIRAKIAEVPEDSKYTSVYERIKVAKNYIDFNNQTIDDHGPTKNINTMLDEAPQPERLMHFENQQPDEATPSQTIPMKFSEYLSLLDETGRLIRENKRGFISDKNLPILKRLNLSQYSWVELINNIGNKFYIALGANQAMLDFAINFGKRSIKGLKSVKKYYLNAAC